MHSPKLAQIQPFSHTGFLRYTDVFATAAHRLRATRGHTKLNILSFGCSVGDEIGTLRHYFPDAHICGCDTNVAVLEIAKRSFTGDPSTSFFASTPQAIAAHGPYDVIAANSVLCINPSPANYAAAFPFSRFDDTLSLFDAALNAEGLMTVTNAAYRFSDSSIAGRYRCIRSDIAETNGFVDVLNKDGSNHLTQERSLGMPVYRRQGDWHGRGNEELADCIFEKPALAEPSPASVFLTIRPPPADLIPYSAFTRRNTDYVPGPAPPDAVIVEHTYSFYCDRNGGKVGISRATKWSAFDRPGLYTRPCEVWLREDPASVAALSGSRHVRPEPLRA